MMKDRMASPFRRSRANSRSNLTGLEDEDKNSHIDNYLRELTNPVAPDIDIVAVHGLNATGKAEHGELTWSKNGVLWLEDEKFLPGRFPNARILLFGYNSRVASGTSSASIMGIAEVLLNRLAIKRIDDPQRPIMFLCHSLGGIVVKQALVRTMHGTLYTSIRLSTRAIAFFGTPHRGGNGANLGRLLADIAKALTGSVSNNFMEILQKDSTIADDIHNLFIQQAQDYQIVSFYETLRFKPFGLIVNKVSATLSLPDSTETIVAVAANHSDICKFATRDYTYELVIENIALLMRHALQPPRIGTPLLTPSISLTDPENRRRVPSITSFQSKESLDNYDTTTSSSRGSSQYGMPTFEDHQSGDSRPISTMDIAPPADPVIILPYISNPDFIGREKIFKTIKDSLSLSRNGQQRVALCGLGGVGKSQIATSYTYWYRDSFPDHSIFWIHCGTADRFRQGLIEVANECKITGIADSNKNHNQFLRLKDWLERNTGFKWLMILDNADDRTIFQDAQDVDESSQDQNNLSSYIPACEHGTILITTRDPKVGKRLANGRLPLQINKMSREEAVMMLKTRLSLAGGEALPHSPVSPMSHQPLASEDDLLRLAQTLDYLPLAMVQAASFITEYRWSIDKYLTLFKNDDIAAVKFLQHKVDDGGIDSDIPRSLYATWKLSIDRIQEAHPKSAALIFLMAHYEQLQIPTLLLQQYVDLEIVEFTIIIGVLERFSLVDKGSDESYNMHRLVQLIVKGELEASGAAGKWQSEALRVLVNQFPSGEYDTKDVCASLESHAVKIIHMPGTTDADKPLVGALQSNLAWYYHNVGRWSSAEEYAEAACNTLQDAHGLRHRETLAAKMRFARILKQNSKTDDAERIITPIVKETKALCGPKDQQYFDSLDLLAVILQTQGKLEDAKKIAQKSLSAKENILERNHESIAESQRRLATILEFSGNYDEAETLITKALNGRRDLINTPDRPTMLIMQRLTFIQRAQGKYVEAEKTVRDYMKMVLKKYGPDHLNTQEARYTFASILFINGQVEEAEKIFLDQVHYIEKNKPFGPDHQYNFFVQNQLGGIRMSQGRYAEALQHQFTAWNGIKKTYGKHHTKPYEYQTSYAAALMTAEPSKLDVAMVELQQAYDGLKKVVGEQHPLTLIALLQLSRAHAAKQNLSLALKLAEQVLRRREKKFSPNHPDILAAREWVFELRTMQKGNQGGSVDLNKIDSSSPNEEKKDKGVILGRKYWGMGPKSTNNTTTGKTDIHDNDDDASTEKKRSFQDDEEKLEKTVSLESTKGKRKSRLGLGMFGRLSYGGSSNKIEDKATEDLIDSDGEDNGKGGPLDLEKTPAYTTNSMNRTWPATERQSDTTTNGSSAYDHKHSVYNITPEQLLHQEDITEPTMPIRRKQVAKRNKSEPKPDVTAELPAAEVEIDVNPAARLNGPGWDAAPFGT